MAHEESKWKSPENLTQFQRAVGRLDHVSGQHVLKGRAAPEGTENVSDPQLFVPMAKRFGPTRVYVQSRDDTERLEDQLDE